MINVMVYRNGNKTKSLWCKFSGFNSTTNIELWTIMRENMDKDINFVDRKNEANDLNYQCLMNLIKSAEKESTASTSDLNKIIRGGGFIEHIKNLTNKIQS